jgi:hypothetical protein
MPRRRIAIIGTVILLLLLSAGVLWTRPHRLRFEVGNSPLQPSFIVVTRGHLEGTNCFVTGWRTEGMVYHHQINPDTGRPSSLLGNRLGIEACNLFATASIRLGFWPRIWEKWLKIRNGFRRGMAHTFSDTSVLWIGWTRTSTNTLLHNWPVILDSDRGLWTQPYELLMNQTCDRPAERLLSLFNCHVVLTNGATYRLAILPNDASGRIGSITICTFRL